VAGFAAIAPGSAPDAAHWDAGHRIRLRAIVSTSFNVVFESLLPVVLYPAIGDERLTLIIASGLVFIYLLFIIGTRLRQMIRAGGLRARRTQVLIAGGLVSTTLFALNALVFASLSVYALALCVQMSIAAVSFYTLLAGD